MFRGLFRTVRRPGVAASLAAVAFLVLVEVVLRVTGAGFVPHFFVRAPDGSLQANRHFGRLFFPERLVREGMPVRLEDPKPRGAFRIFVLGESAALGFPVPRFGFPRLLERLASEAYPGERVEVANVAMAGINSHAVRRIAREVVPLEADALVIFMGNNEVIGPFGPGTVFGDNAPSLTRARAAIALRSTRLGQVLDAWLDRLTGRDEVRWGGLEMFAERRIPADHPAMDAVYRNFRRNLREILRIADHAGLPVVLCTVAVNLTDYAPLAGEDALSAWAEALGAVSAGDPAAARTAFLRARDLDELRFRADGVINNIIREEAAASGRVVLVDAEEDFLSAPGGLDDGDLFWEHVHFTPQGNDLLARAVFAALEPVLTRHFGEMPRPLPAPDDLLAGAGWTPAEEVFAIDDMLLLVEREPFASQPGASARSERLTARRADHAARWDQTDKQVHATAMREQVARHPHDIWQRVALAQALAAAGDTAGDAAEKRLIASHLPFDVTTLVNLGHAELAVGDLPAADTAFAKAAQIDPLASAPVLGLATVAMREGRSRCAIAILEKALRHDPHHAEILIALAQIHRYEGRQEDAREALHKILDLEPGHPAALQELGVLGTRSSN